MRAMVVFMPLPCSTVPKICHWSRSLLFGKQLTMIIQFSKHIMLLAFFFTEKTNAHTKNNNLSFSRDGIRKWEPNGIVGQLRHINIRGKKEIYVQSCEAKKK